MKEKNNICYGGFYMGVNKFDGEIVTADYDKHKNADENFLVLGRAGQGKKIIRFKESEFKKELAPSNSKIEYETIEGQNFVTMSYPV